MVSPSTPGSSRRRPVRSRVRGATSLRTTLIAAIVLVATAGPVADAVAAPTPVVQAPALEWGFKLSWRQYAGLPALAGGATQLPEASAAGYDVGWAFDGGSYDETTRTTVLGYRGSARWHSHSAAIMGIAPPPGYSGPLDVDLLDLTLTDPVVTISAERATISAEARSRDLDTWQIVDYGRIDVVDLALDGVTPAVAGGATTWSGVPATMSAQASPVFGEVYYPVGVQVDVVGFTYSGPGGAPDLSEQFDAPGRIKLAPQGDNVLLAPPTTPTGFFETMAVDPGRRLAHTRLYSADDDTYTYGAFDLDAMQTAGEPLVLPWASFDTALLNETTSGRIYGATDSDSYPRSWLRYDADAGEYVQGDDVDAIPASQDYATLSWDPVGERAFEVVLSLPDGVAPDDYDARRWQLRTYLRQPDETWETRTYDLPNGPAHLNAFRFQRLGVAAADGSLILLGDFWASRPVGAVVPPAQVPGAYRVVTHADGTADVEAISGSEVPNQIGRQFALALAADDGTVALVAVNGGGIVQRFDVTTPGGGPIAAEGAVELGFPASDIPAEGATIDPQDGTVWVGGTKSKRIVAVRDGRLVADQTFALRNTRAGALIAGPDHTLVMQSNDGSDSSLTESAYGFQKLAPVGVTPTVTSDPAAQAITLGTGQDSAQTSFTASATGDPAPQLRWQAKAPGATRFRDVDGQTGTTLTLEARRGMDGTQYRAVFENAAGSVAGAPATLSVDYAPRVVSEPLSQTATEGRPATFQLLADGNPEPALTWQRRVGGYWQPIAVDDDNFAVDGGTLTVRETNTEQSGSLFRAKLASAAGTAYSRVVTLTVQPRVVIPPSGIELEHATLDWVGNAELQRAPPFGAGNFFSAGVSDGGELTYSAATGNVRILQVSASGTESPATWATRASHVAGGGKQLVRLYGGHGRIEPDGATTVRWQGAFSVNFYGGLVPFTLTDPRLTIGSDGSGTLRADLSGYASSQADPHQRTLLPPVPDVTVATFADVQIDPAGAISIAPDFAGVEVALPPAAAPQQRDGSGWGAWPQPFVDFQVGTGLASYWYSSGGAADAYKPPSPFVVDLSGVELPIDPPPALQPDPVLPRLRPLEPASILVPRRPRRIGPGRIAKLLSVRCPAGAPCAVRVAERMTVRIGGRRYRATILAPARIGAGQRAVIRVKLSKPGARRLEGRRATVRLRLTVTHGDERTTRTVAVIVRG